MSWLRGFWKRLTNSGPEEKKPVRPVEKAKTEVAHSEVVPKPKRMPPVPPVRDTKPETQLSAPVEPETSLRGKLLGNYRPPSKPTVPTVNERPKPTPKQEVVQPPTPKKQSAFFKKAKPQKVHVQVGLDFGTSSTKVAFRRLDDKRVAALDFKHGLKNYPGFVLPSIATVVPGKGIVFGSQAAKIIQDEGLDKGLRNIKVILAGKYDTAHEDEESRALFYNNLGHLREPLEGIAEEYVCSLYLAYAMQESKKVLGSESLLSQVIPDLAWNVCLPIDHIEKNELWVLFQKMLACSELCFQQWDKLSKSNFDIGIWRGLWDQASYGSDGPLSYIRKDPAARVFAIPESVAQVASYLESLQRQHGLHALIDFGAGTTDVSIFNLTQDEKLYWYSSSNIPEGGRALEDGVARILESDDKGVKVDLGTVNLVLGQLANPYIKAAVDFDENEVGMLLDSHLISIYTSSSNTWGDASNKLRDSNQWKEVTIFKGGGASSFQGLDEVFQVPVGWGHGNKGIKYDVKRVPEPTSYQSGRFAPFVRLSVAYGLSIPGPQLQDYVLPKDTEDHTPPVILVDPQGGFDGGYTPNPTRGWLGG